MENAGENIAPVDFTRIQETSDGDIEFEKELFAVFLEDCEERVNKLRASISGRDLEAIHMEAHTIKGAGANVGTTHLHEIAAQLENIEEAEVSGSGHTLLGELEIEYLRVKVATENYLSSL